LKLNYDELLSTSAFNFILRRYKLVAKPWVAGDTLAVRVNCRDRFGNAVQPPSPDNQVGRCRWTLSNPP
jgi:hypothetical protein